TWSGLPRCYPNGPAHRERPIRPPILEPGVFLADNAGAAVCCRPQIFPRNRPHSPRSLRGKPSLALATDHSSGHPARLETENRGSKSKEVRPLATELSSTQLFVAAPHQRCIHHQLPRQKPLFVRRQLSLVVTWSESHHACPLGLNTTR